MRRRTVFPLLALVAGLVLIRGSAGALAAQSSTTVITSLSIGSLIGFDADHHYLVDDGVATPSHAATLELRTVGGTRVASTVLPSRTGYTAVGDGVVAATFYSAPTPTHVLVYSTATLALLANVDVGFTPSSVAVAGGKVWLTNPSDASLYAFTIAAPHTLTVAAGFFPATNSKLEGARSTPATVYARTPTSPVATLQAIAVDATPTVTGTHLLPIFQNMAVSADGSTVAVAEDTNGVELLDPTTLSVSATLANPSHATAVALSPDGSRVVVSDSSDDLSSALYWVEDASGTPLYTDDPNPANDPLSTFGVGMTVTSDSSFSVLGYTGVPSDPHPLLLRFTVPSTPTLWTDLSVSGSTPHQAIGDAATFSGRVLGAPQAGVGGATVDVSVDAPDGTSTDLGTVTAGSDGSFAYTSAPLNHTGTWTFTFDVPAANGYTHVSRQMGVAILGQPDTLTVSASKNTIVYGDRIRVVAKLRPFTPGATVTLTRRIGTVTTTLYHGPVDASGDVAIDQQRPLAKAVYRASFAGDGTYNPVVSPARIVTVLPIISGAFVGGYGTSGAYRLFHYSTTCTRTHNSGCPHFAAKMVPNHQGKVVTMVIQQLTSSGWTSIVAYRRTLGLTSKAEFPVPYLNTKVIGHRYRIVTSFAGDADHGAVSWGYWYFRITR